MRFPFGERVIVKALSVFAKTVPPQTFIQIVEPSEGFTLMTKASVPP